MTVIPERLAQLDTLTLDQGKHRHFDDGHCAMEVVAWLAGEGNTDAPACASPVLRRYTIALNDRWDTERRQTLKPYLPRMVGTGGDGKDEARLRVATRFLCTDLLGPWLRLAGMGEHADSLAALTAATPSEIRRFLYQAQDEAWRRRRESIDAIRAKVRQRLADRPAVDVAVDAAVAVAVDAAAAVAVDAAVDVDAAVAAAVDVAVAVAVAAAVAVDVAVDAAVAAAPHWKQYDAAYAAVRDYFRKHPLAISEKVQALAAEQRPLALALLDQLIDPRAEG